MGLDFLDSICYFQIPDLLSLLVMYTYFFLLFRQVNTQICCKHYTVQKLAFKFKVDCDHIHI